ncbi:rheacalcin-1 [Gadus morhua]|uniref:rheacalcin-1 n=1 Tax=Gadus morhua TaxID=8049 RepID=UPI0011B819AB|nr:rheacalcin-1-like [Gadus morhua]
MATVWFLFAVLCIATAAVVPKAEEADVALRQIEEELKQKEGVLKEVVMAAAPSEKAMKEVGGSLQVLGAHLASIHNPADNRFLKQLVTLGGQNDVWIGSYFLQTRWRWIDGTGMYYQDFLTTPSSTSYACTCLRSSGWAKASCSSNMRFICSTSPGSC